MITQDLADRLDTPPQPLRLTPLGMLTDDVNRSLPWPVELGRKESRSRLQDRVGPPQLGVLPLQPLQLGRLLAGDTRALALIDLGLPDPASQGLRGRDPDQFSDLDHHRPITPHSPGGSRDTSKQHEPSTPPDTACSCCLA